MTKTQKKDKTNPKGTKRGKKTKATNKLEHKMKKSRKRKGGGGKRWREGWKPSPTAFPTSKKGSLVARFLDRGGRKRE